MIKAVCWGVLVLILLAAVILALYIAGMTLYFHYQLKDGRIKREYTEEQRRADEEQIQAIRESPVVPHATTIACAELFDQIQAAKKE